MTGERANDPDDVKTNIPTLLCHVSAYMNNTVAFVTEPYMYTQKKQRNCSILQATAYNINQSINQQIDKGVSKSA
jgi:hypothetical protein